MNNPYEVLGVRQGATETEIKEAYKKLVKKYHPDKYQNNPLADLAEEKLQEINEAYDTLTKGNGRSYGSHGSNPGNYGSQSYGDSANSANYGEFMPVRQALDRNDLVYAEQLLVNNANRNAEWFFLSGVLSFKKGWVDDGLTNVRQAIEMDANNQEYRRVYQQMQSAGMMYRGRSNGQGYNRSSDPCVQCIECYCCSSLISPCW